MSQVSEIEKPHHLKESWGLRRKKRGRQYEENIEEFGIDLMGSQSVMSKKDCPGLKACFRLNTMSNLYSENKALKNLYSG